MCWRMNWPTGTPLKGRLTREAAPGPGRPDRQDPAEHGLTRADLQAP